MFRVYITAGLLLFIGCSEDDTDPNPNFFEYNDNRFEVTEVVCYQSKTRYIVEAWYKTKDDPDFLISEVIFDKEPEDGTYQLTSQEWSLDENSASIKLHFQTQKRYRSKEGELVVSRTNAGLTIEFENVQVSNVDLLIHSGEFSCN